MKAAWNWAEEPACRRRRAFACRPRARRIADVVAQAGMMQAISPSASTGLRQLATRSRAVGTSAQAPFQSRGSDSGAHHLQASR